MLPVLPPTKEKPYNLIIVRAWVEKRSNALAQICSIIINFLFNATHQVLLLL